MKNREPEEVQDPAGKEKLLEEIRKNAVLEAKKIVSQAELSAGQKLESVKARAERIVQESKTRAEEKIRLTEKNTEAMVNVQKKRIRLQRNEEIVQEIFAGVKKRLNDKIGTDSYGEILLRWAVEALAGLDADRAVLAVSKHEQQYLTEDFIGRVKAEAEKIRGKKISLETADEPCKVQGVLARSSDGRLEFRNQIDTILRRRHSELRKIIYHSLNIEGTE